MDDAALVVVCLAVPIAVAIYFGAEGFLAHADKQAIEHAKAEGIPAPPPTENDPWLMVMLAGAAIVGFLLLVAVTGG